MTVRKQTLAPFEFAILRSRTRRIFWYRPTVVNIRVRLGAKLPGALVMRVGFALVCRCLCSLRAIQFRLVTCPRAVSAAP